MGAVFEKRPGPGVVDEDGFEGTAQSAESAGGGLTTMLQVQVLLEEQNEIN